MPSHVRMRQVQAHSIKKETWIRIKWHALNLKKGLEECHEARATERPFSTHVMFLEDPDLLD